MNKLYNESKKIFTIDFGLMAIILVLYAISMFGIYMSAPLLGAELNVYDLMFKQTTWLAFGFLIIFVLIKFGIDRLFTGVYVLYWILMFFMLLLLVHKYTPIPIPFARVISGTAGWYVFPAIGSFQPSEFMKIVLVIIFANIIYTHNLDKEKFSFRSDFQLIFKIAKYAIPALLLNLLQPDTGIPIVIVVSLAVMFFVSGVRKEWALVIFLLAMGALLLIVWLYYNNPALLNRLFGGSEDSYKLRRFYGWLDYEKYHKTDGFQLYNGLLSFGTAGLTGHPLGSKITQFPEAQTDFIFAVITTNTGLIGAFVVISLSFLLDYKLLRITMNSDLPKERYMMIGVVAMLTFQQFENIAMILGLLPITGITLPFISYGGSSYSSYMIPLAVAFYMYSETKNAHRH